MRAGFGAVIRFCGFWGGTVDFGRVARSCFGVAVGPGLMLERSLRPLGGERTGGKGVAR